MRNFDLAALKFWAAMITLAVLVEAFLIGQIAANPKQDGLSLSDEIHGTWLTIKSRKSDPCFTSIESDFKPHIEKKGAKWLITFGTDDLATEFQP